MTKQLLIAICLPLLWLNSPLSQAQKTVEQYDTPFEKVPDPRDVSIYQVNIRTFSEGGNFQGVTERLDNIQDLGVNVIYLMPIYPIGKVKGVNSPYCIRDYIRINEEFGNLEDLRVLVKQAHERGMAVILDWVANHTAWDNEWIENKSWYLQNPEGQIISPPGTGWNDVAQLNFSNDDMRAAMISSMKYWVLAANIDGFRCDYSDGPPFDFWQQALDTLRNNTGHKLIMLSEGRRSDQFTAGFDYNFGFDFFDNLKEIYSHGKSVTSIDSFNVANYQNASALQGMVRYTSNHDVNSSDGTPQELFGGTRGSMAAFVVVTYMKSIPMIYSGQEVGTPYRLLFPFTSANIDWTINPELTAEYKQIISFRNESEAVRRGTLKTFSNDDVCVFTKSYNNETMLVISNLRKDTIQFKLPASIEKNEWVNAFEENTEPLNEALISLLPFQYLVLKKVDVSDK